MATPLLQFQNARIQWYAPGERGDASTGFQQLPGAQYVIGAFLKQVTANKRADYKDMVDLKISTEVFQGYITDWAEIADTDDWRTIDYTSSDRYDISGKRPPGFVGAPDIEVFMSGQQFTGRLRDSGGVFFDQGIGQIVRDVIGDRLVVTFERWD